jgi:hypothetical protein
MAEAVLTGSHYMQGACGWRCGSLAARLGDEKILQTGNRRRGGHGFEKRSASHRGSFRSVERETGQSIAERGWPGKQNCRWILAAPLDTIRH